MSEKGGGEKLNGINLVKIKLYIPSMYTLFRALLKTWEKKSHLFIITLIMTPYHGFFLSSLFSSDYSHIIIKKLRQHT